MKQYIFTSESVSEGHPDKVCDKISDGILDAYLEQDPFAKVACETLATTGNIIISGEINTDAKVDVEQIVRNVLLEIGYDDEKKGMDANTCKITNLLEQQSPDIAQGVDLENEEIGAGDQGIMFGYAENSNSTYMPLPIVIAHRLVELATQLRKSGAFTSSRPDMKSQVSLLFEGDKVYAETIVFSIQHDDDYHEKSFREYIQTSIIDVVLDEFSIDKSPTFTTYINPTGRFVIGGPHGDTGLTGRKIIVDTYGGYSRHGGGAFSGKDATKVDRSGAYMARYLAKNIVASGVADRCEVQLAYAIGVAEPVAIYLDTFGTEKIAIEKIQAILRENISMTPRAIIERFELRRPIFSDTAAYGHFGRENEEFLWEKLDLSQLIKEIAKL